MHDLKNLIAQQSLVVKNAARHKGNPAFFEDAIATNAISKAITRLRSEDWRDGRKNRRPTDVEALVAEIWAEVSDRPTYGYRRACEFVRELGIISLTTPVQCPQSNGMVEAFVNTLKRDYVSVNAIPDATSALAQLPGWIEHYNEHHSCPRRDMTMGLPKV